MARIYRRGKSWGVDYVDPSGKRVRQMIGDKADALQELSKILKEEEKTDRPAVTIAQLKAEYIKFLEDKNLRQTTLANEVSSLKMLDQYQYLHQVTDKEVQIIIGRMKTAGNKGQTMNNKLDRLCRAFAYALDQGYISANPFYETCRIKEDEPRPRRDLAPAEVAALLENSEGEYQCRWAVYLYTGFRASNVANLQWEWINFQNMTITIPKSEFKTNTETIIPLHSKLAKILQAWAPKAERQGRVFPDKSNTAVRNALSRDCERAGLDQEGVDLHALRHTFASALLNAGTRIEVISRLLGHKNIETTQRYLHYDKTTLEDGIKNLPY